MMLTVDIGNSRIKWALWQADRITARGVSAYTIDAAMETFDELFSPVESKTGDEPGSRPQRVSAVCVAGEEIASLLSEWVKQHWCLDVEYLETKKQFGNIINAYENPAQHGVDRWAGVVAGHLRFPGFSVCVISAGTAITFDLINKTGLHLGGYILPSYASMHAALLADTANVSSEFNAQFQQDSVPDNTSDAVNQGLHKLIQAGIRELCQFAQDKMDQPMQIIITGGFAEAILDYPDMPVMRHEPDLVMQGLYDIMTSQKD